MSRLIDADAIPYTMLYKENWLKGTGVEKPGVWKDTIDAMPTIEARKKGRWTSDNSCPFCGFQPWYEHDIHTLSYCPNCGADMRGE